MKKQISIDALNEHLFETIEMLKNNNDPEASENEKIDVDKAKIIADLGKVVVEGYKVKAQVIGIVANAGNPELLKKLFENERLILSAENK